MTNSTTTKAMGPSDNPPISEALAMFVTGRDYCVAFVRESDGSFDVIERFMALDDDAANGYAAERYADRDWYVLDDAMRNINAGRDR